MGFLQYENNPPSGQDLEGLCVYDYLSTSTLIPDFNSTENLSSQTTISLSHRRHCLQRLVPR